MTLQFSEMKLSIIISYYKALDNLLLILKGLNRQSDMRFEVIISEDDCNQETIEFIDKNRALYNFEIQHVHQAEDLGFRKTMMLNKSIQASRTDFLVFIDGDCIPARHFAKQYIQYAGDNQILWGRRVMLGPKLTSEIIRNNSLRKLNFFSTFFSDSYKTKEAIYSPLRSLSFKNRGLKGCNWGVSKKHLLAVNGFDEDYKQAAVGEDNDIEWRLTAIGLTKVSMKNKAIVYHLYHPRGYSNEVVNDNFRKFQDKQRDGNIRCLNGLEDLTDSVTSKKLQKAKTQ